MEIVQIGIRVFKIGAAAVYDNLKGTAPPSAQTVASFAGSGTSAQFPEMSNQTIFTPKVIAGLSAAAGGCLLLGVGVGVGVIFLRKYMASKQPEYLVIDPMSEEERLFTGPDYSSAEQDYEDFSAPNTAQNSPVCSKTVEKEYC